MNEALYYIGTIFSIIFAIAAVGSFFFLRIPSVISYLLDHKGIRFSNKKIRKKVKNAKDEKASEETELLEEAKESSTALLDEECTELLSDIEM